MEFKRTLGRLNLMHGPTPLRKSPGLDRKFGIDLWIKCDDASGGAIAGNKVRKLEFLLAEARRHNADTIVTCGGLQSNHARATAIACASLGLKCILFLRGEGGDASAPLPMTGNVLLDKLTGAEVHQISAADYTDRNALMESHAAFIRLRGASPYVIPEGGSNGLGALGYVEAMREVRAQMDVGLGGGKAPFFSIVHACGSGGTTAGIALGAKAFNVAEHVRAVLVLNDAAAFGPRIANITSEATAFDESLKEGVELVLDESARGPAYGLMSTTQRRLLIDVARLSGMILDPAYSGKAFDGLALAVERGDIPAGARVLFVHTGGLPGLLAQGDAFLRDFEDTSSEHIS